MNPPKIILASASPRRHQVLCCLGIAHTVEAADIDETAVAGESPSILVERLAIAKALVVGNRLTLAASDEWREESTNCSPPTIAVQEVEGLLVIGADTVVAIGPEILGKPAHADEAVHMLQRLRTSPHQVHSALAIAHFVGACCERLRSRVNTTRVDMRCYSDEEIVAYVATGDPLDKAGAYGLQDRAFRPVSRLVGCPTGVMGLASADLQALLAEFGISVAQHPTQFCHNLTGFPCCQTTQIPEAGDS